MTRDDIIRMAREDCPYTSDEMRGAFYEGFLKGAAAEREACAEVCEREAERWEGDDGPISAEARLCAIAIRNRAEGQR